MLLDELRHEQGLCAAAVARAKEAEARAADVASAADAARASHAREVELARRSARAWELRAVAAEETVKILQAEHADRGRRSKQVEDELVRERTRAAHLVQEVSSLETQRNEAMAAANAEVLRADGLRREVARLERRAAEAGAASAQSAAELLRSTTQQYEDTIASLVAELDDLRAQLAQVEARHRDAEARAQSSEKTRASIASTVVKHAAEQAELKRALESTKAEVASLLSQLDARETAGVAANAKLFDELAETRKRLDTQREGHVRELDTLRAELDAARREVADVNAALMKMSEVIEMDRQQHARELSVQSSEQVGRVCVRRRGRTCDCVCTGGWTGL